MASAKAHEVAERFLRQRLIIRDFDAMLNFSSQWQRLPERPVTHIGGDLAVAVDIDASGVGWVRLDRDRTIKYRAGLAYTEDALPPLIRSALDELDKYLERGGDADQPPWSILALLVPYRCGDTIPGRLTERLVRSPSAPCRAGRALAPVQPPNQPSRARGFRERI